jgi:hypothetical protein
LLNALALAEVEVVLVRLELLVETLLLGLLLETVEVTEIHLMAVQQILVAVLQAAT